MLGEVMHVNQHIILEVMEALISSFTCFSPHKHPNLLGVRFSCGWVGENQCCTFDSAESARDFAHA
jgi:hypothetical protein